MASQIEKKTRSLSFVINADLKYVDIIRQIHEGKGLLGSFKASIEGIINVEGNKYLLTYKKPTEEDKTDYRKAFYEQTGGNIRYENGELTFVNPDKKTAKINIKARPLEIDDIHVWQEFEKLNCGKITKIERVKHRGTDLYNGYRTVHLWL